MEKKEVPASGGLSAINSLSGAEQCDLQRCDFEGLILYEELMLKGIATTLDEYGCSGNEEIEVPATSLWMLGKVLSQTREALLRKLVIARECLQAVGVPQMFEVRLAKGTDAPPAPQPVDPRRPVNGKGKRPAAA